MEINNEVGLFHADNNDISYHILQFIQNPQQLIQISMVSKTANEHVQLHCRWLIKTAELIPNCPFEEFTFLKTPLWVYVHLVYPIIRAREEFQVLHPQMTHKKTDLIHYLTDCKLSSQQYMNHSPLEAVISYGCPILFEKILKIRFSTQEIKYSKAAIASNDQVELGILKSSQTIFRLVIAEYEARRALIQESSITETIARSRNLTILKRWIMLFPTLLTSPKFGKANIYSIIAIYGSCDMMGYLLDLLPDGIGMILSSKTFTIVHYAAQANRVDMLEFLCKNQFDLNVITDCGKTPLYVACESLALEAISFLLRKKGDLNKTIHQDQPRCYQDTRITPLSRLIFSQYTCDIKNITPVIIDMILAGAYLDKCALMTLFDETFTIQGYVINSLFVRGNITLCNARRFILSLIHSLADRSISVKEVLALTTLCRQFLNISKEFPMRSAVVKNVKKLLDNLESYQIEKYNYYHSVDRHDPDDSSFVLCV